MRLTIAKAASLRTKERPIVVLNNGLIGVASIKSFQFNAWTNPYSAAFMSRWCPPLPWQPNVRQLRVPQTMALGALQKFLNHLKRVADSANCWRIAFRGSLQLLLPNNRITTIVVDNSGVSVERVAKWWAARYNYKRVA